MAELAKIGDRLASPSTPTIVNRSQSLGGVAPVKVSEWREAHGYGRHQLQVREGREQGFVRLNGALEGGTAVSKATRLPSPRPRPERNSVSKKKIIIIKKKNNNTINK